MKGSSIQLTTLIIGLTLIIGGCKKLSNNAEPEQQASMHIERAESYRRQGQYRAAIIEARNAIDAAPNDARGPLELATLLNDLNQGKQAFLTLEKLGENNDKAVILARADALLLQGKFRSALEYLQAHRSDDDEFRFRLAQAQAGLGQTTEAENTFATLVNSSHAVAAKLQLARMNFQSGNSDSGNALLQQIFQVEPDQIDALIVSAQQAEANGDLEHAEELLSRTLIKLPQTDIITPQKVTVLRHLMPILTKLGRSSESLVYAKVLADADPEGAVLQGKFKQGIEAFQAGKFNDAESLLKEVYDASHDNYAGLLLGMIKYNQKDYSGAATYLGETADPEIAPDSALKALASAELRLGQSDKLLQLFGPDDRAHIKDPELKVLIGLALVQSGNGSAGEKMLAETLRDNPNNIPVRATLARHYLATRQTEKAISLLEEGLVKKFDPDLARLAVGAYVAANKIDAALQVARTLAATTPEQAINDYVLGHTALIAQRYDASADALKKALALQPDYTPALLDTARLSLLRKQPQQAVAIYERTIAANGNDTDALKGFITALEMTATKPDQNAIEDAAFKLTSTDTARAVVAEYYLRNHRRDDAHRLLSAIDLPPGTSNNYAAYVKQLYALAEASELLRNKDFTHARLAALEGLQLNPRDINLLALLSQIALDAGDSKEAGKIIDQLAQVAPNSPGLANLRAIQFERAGDLPQAQRYYEIALKQNANNALTLNNLALIYFKQGDSRALGLAAKAFALAPNNPAVLDTYGWILVGSNERDKGIALLQQAAKLKPDATEIAEHLKSATQVSR